MCPEENGTCPGAGALAAEPEDSKRRTDSGSLPPKRRFESREGIDSR
jgi:hypothetical protein